MYVKSPERVTIPCQTKTDSKKQALLVSFSPTSKGVHVIEVHSMNIEYRKHSSLEVSLVARFAVQAGKRSSLVGNVSIYIIFPFLVLL